MTVSPRSRWWRPIASLVIFMGTALLVLFWVFNHFFSDPPSADNAAWAQRHGRKPGQALDKLWRMPAFHGMTQEGHPLDGAALRGNVWVTDFIYTRCTSACPTLTARMILLSHRLNPAVHLLSVSVDPDFDRPPVLAAYTRRWPQPALPWTLVAFDPGTLKPFARDMHILVDRDPDDATDITHSSHLFLIDRDGWVRGVYDSQDHAALTSLATDAATLVGSASPSRPTAALATGGEPKELGRQLYTQLGCNGCHADARTGPPMGGFGTRQVALEGGGKATTDQAYLRAAILQPQAKLVLGYGPTMPSYEGIVNPAQLAGLVTYLQSLPAPTAAAATGSAVDPVCHMKLSITEATPRLKRGGTTYYFCSDTCRTRFAENPDHYRRAPPH